MAYGNEVIFGVDYPLGSTFQTPGQVMTRYRPNISGTLIAIVLWGRGVSGSVDFGAACFSDNSGLVGNLLTQDTGNFTQGTSAARMVLPVTPVAVTNTDDLWLDMWASGNFEFFFEGVGATQTFGTEDYAFENYTNNPTNPPAVGLGYTSNRISIAGIIVPSSYNFRTIKGLMKMKGVNSIKGL
jgi:hypothetical protein